MKHSAIIFGLIVFLATITSCSQIEKRGYSFELSEYKLLQEKISKKSDTLNLMGYPSFISELAQKELWVYYSEDVENLLFFKPSILDRKIITISFNDKGFVEKIKSYDLKNQVLVKLNSDYTTLISQKKSWWSRIFGNIGQVRAN